MPFCVKNEQITLYSTTDGRIMSEREDPAMTGQTAFLAFLRSLRPFLNDPSWGGGGGNDKKKLEGKVRQGRRLEAGFGIWNQAIILVYLKSTSHLGNSRLSALPFKTNLFILVYEVLVCSFYMPINTTPL